jgi:copper chaperone
MQTRLLSISGMTCGHCVQAVTKSLSAVPGVSAVLVSLDRQEARVEGDADLAALLHAVTSEGYGAKALAA